jgi:glycosyltransferase involved in cell wall biosynthesis
MPFSDAMKEVAIEISTHYANLCDGVIAPSESLARIIRKRGVVSPIRVVPTGIDVQAFASANGGRYRQRLGLAADSLVIGHVGRLAQEKNLRYLAEGVARFLAREPGASFLVVGGGPAREELKDVFAHHGVADRLMLAGKRTGRVLREAYRAMDVFAFASQTETQGMVVAEAMASGLPVVALNASGVREVVRDDVNGFLLPADALAKAFADALARCAEPGVLARLSQGARDTAPEFSREQCARRALAFYEEMRRATRARRLLHHLSPWAALVKRVGLEWDLLSSRTQTVAAAVFGEGEEKEKAS